MARLHTLASAILAAAIQAAEPSAWTCSFDEAAALPGGWATQGAVGIATSEAFKGPNALVMERPSADREKPCTVTGPVFPLAAGTWEFTCATSSDLESPDASFSGVVAIETLDAAGKVLERTEIADPFGKRTWALARKRLVVPEAAVSARFSMRLNKTIGRFRVDELSAKPVADARKPSAVNRIVFRSPPVGNLFKPEDARTFTITVESTRELADSERVLTWSVRDYWSAEQAPAATVPVTADGKNKDRFRYKAGVDIAAIPLDIGRYYEIHAQIPLADDEPFRNWSSFAVLPEAPSKAYKPAQIPFVSRNWDNRVREYMHLADRLGVRTLGLWGDNGIDIAAKLGMAVMTGAPGGVVEIEHHRKGYEKWLDEGTMRADIRAWFAKNGKHQPGPMTITLGNEPNNTGERLKEAVAAYKITYDEIKKVAPETVVVSTSIGASEEYFQLGYQDACDVFDFHVYESPRDVRRAIERFQVLMKTYNCVKPVWSTEIGLNAQGMTRQYIAGDMARKITAFFAAGGASIAWFGFNYPDGDGKAGGTTGDAFNMVDSRYNTYGPRLDAIMYYNLINGILVKQFAGEREWKGGLTGSLFRDADGKCFTLLWKDKGSADVVFPLPGVKEVRCVRIDGRVSTLDAGGNGIGLSISDDPILLQYSGPAALPESLGDPVVRIASAPERLVRGVPAVLELATKADPQRISVLVPPAWMVERSKDDPLRFTITSPETSMAKAGDILIRLADAAGATNAELGWRPTVAGRLGVEIRPLPAIAGGQPSAQVVVRNLAAQPQTVHWTFALTGEQIMEKGQFAAMQASTAFLADSGSGTVTVAANSQQVVTVPLSGIDPIRLYHATSSITDASGGTVSSSRVIGGFAGVPRAASPTVDGVLDEATWAKATACPLDQAGQFYGFGKSELWKGPQDLSASLRFQWDDSFLYVGVTVTDDVFANTKADGGIWAGDGLQFLFDPARHQAEKPGKYDAGFAVGTKGPQAWYWLTGTSAVNAGLQSDIVVAMKRGDKGNATYEVAIPWAKLAPFQPSVGANLGACMIVNEDDGPGRKSFIGWFGNPHSKQIDTAGDLVLLGE